MGSYGGNYGGPKGFCFDVLCGSDETIERSSEDDMRDKMRSFADKVVRQAGKTKGRNVMLMMGMDLWFSDVGRNYANLDLLIEAADRHFREDEGAISVFDGAVVYNAISNSQTEIVPLPVDSSSMYIVEHLQDVMTWSAVASSLFPNHNYTMAPSAAKYTLYFNASDLPPLGAAVFRITSSKEEDELDATYPAAVARSMSEINIVSLFASNRKPPDHSIRANSDRNRFNSQDKDNDFQASNGILSVVIDR